MMQWERSFRPLMMQAFQKTRWSYSPAITGVNGFQIWGHSREARCNSGKEGFVFLLLSVGRTGSAPDQTPGRWPLPWTGRQRSFHWLVQNQTPNFLLTALT